MPSFNEIANQIIQNPNCGISYVALGDYYLHHCNNINQAYICYEYAYNHCSSDEKESILSKMKDCKNSDEFSVNPVSFIILSYNAKAIMQECLNAIRHYCDKGTYETIIVDNVSTDGIREWLIDQTDIKLILNNVNSGFAADCNQGAKIANPQYDIMLLNNDAIITERSILYMRLALYTDKNIGLVGPQSCNVIPEQCYNNDNNIRTKDDWFIIAQNINQPSEYPLQASHWLQGHALLIKRKVWDEIGGLDTNFNFGGAEDLEYGIRANAMGYKTCICKNSFIYHYGSTSMKTKPVEYSIALANNHRLFERKYGIPVGKVLESYHYSTLDLIDAPNDKPIRVLEIYGGFSNTLNMIKYKYPLAEVYAIEKDAKIAHIASNYLNVTCCDIENTPIPFEYNFFDYIIMIDAIEYINDTLGFLKSLRKYLKSDGHLLLGNRNADHISVINSIIHGNFANMTNPTNLLPDAKHFFTTDDMWHILDKCGYTNTGLIWTYSSDFTTLTESQQKTLDMILQLPDAKDRNTYIHTGAIFSAMPKN
ncbi:glycosyltransferase [Agathobacter sp.]